MSSPESYRQYVLGLLVVVYVFNFIDRQILGILLRRWCIDRNAAAALPF